MSNLNCTPKTIKAGGKSTCELKLAASSTVNQIMIASTSSRLKVPAAISTRPNQTSLSFQVNADAAAGQESIEVAASAGGPAVQDTVAVAAADGPALSVPDSQMAKLGNPVRFAISAADATDMPVQLSAAGLPAGAVFDVNSGKFEWTPVQLGKYTVTFMGSNAAGQSSTAQVAIDVTSGNPALTKMERACSPGAIGVVSGSWLADALRGVSDPSGNSMTLNGVKVRINNQQVPVLLGSAARVEFLCSQAQPGAQLQVEVETSGGITQPLTTVMQSASPWIFALDAPGQNQGLVSFPGSADLAMARNPQLPAHPAQAGDKILIFGTGFEGSGDMSLTNISANLNGENVPVEAVTPVTGKAGVYMIQVQAPDSANVSGEVPLQIQITNSDGKMLSSNTVTIAVEPKPAADGSR